MARQSGTPCGRNMGNRAPSSDTVCHALPFLGLDWTSAGAPFDLVQFGEKPVE
jgi:hypothetical protein